MGTKTLEALMMLCVVGAFVAAAAALSEEEPAAPAEPATKDLQTQMQELRAQMRDLRRELGVVEGRIEKDPEVAAAKKALDEARQAYDNLFNEKLAADPEGAALLEQEKTLKEQLKGVMDVWRESLKDTMRRDNP